MNSENVIASRHDDAVFDNRNKAYGAYTIRKSYESNLSKGSAAGLLFVGLLFAAIQAILLLHPEVEFTIPKIPFVGPIPEPKIIPEPQPQKEVRTQPRTHTDFPPRAVSNPVSNPPPVETQTTSTGGNTGSQETGVPSIGVIDLTTAAPPVVAVQPKTTDIAEVMPQFEGGAKALYKFLGKTLHYPRAAQRAGQEGTVYMRFIIDVTGAVTGVEVLTGVTAVLDAEASRVIRLMPRWKPGSQHGEPVNVRMVLPIKFAITED